MARSFKAFSLCGLVLAVSGGLFAGSPDDGGTVLTVRTIPLENEAWAGSSVNVLAGVRQTLYTDSVHQVAAYYDASRRLVLAKRRIGEDEWEKHRTSFTGNTRDAHNYISLVVDGAGHLHVAWDHHDNPLNYARSVAPGSLEITQAEMVGSREDSVSYPQFYRLEDGGLLFQYRDGGSGRGVLVMNRYDVASGRWQRVHDRLVDGEGERSAYWDMAVDPLGNLHLAWIWRETPDVASNHDLMYAVSRDGGLSWHSTGGEQLELPLTLANGPVVRAVGENRKLMNPPVVASDARGNPFVASYWADAPGGTPRYHVLHHAKGTWEEIEAPEARENFDLSGGGTKRPPLSRAALLVESDWRRSWFHLIYRDDFARAIVALTVPDLERPEWQVRSLLQRDVGGWEPSIDPEQWERLKQVQMLLQRVDQLDGDDATGSGAAPSRLEVLVWSPSWERHRELNPQPSQAPDIDLEAPLRAESVLAVAEKAAWWQWENIPEGWDYQLTSWTLGPFYIGTLAVAELLPDSGLEERMIEQGRALGWQPHERLYDADDHVVMQAYLRLYLKHRDEAMIAPSRERLDAILADPPTTSLDWGTPQSRDRWSWCDALFMGPMSWLLMSEATGEEKYLEYMNREWWATSERLYRPRIGLFFRDESYMDLREPNGETIHWARGTGWSFAGLAQVLEHLPEDHPDRPRYEQQYREMCRAFLDAQQADGLWRPGLLDPETHTATETSGSSFAVFALAWGINHGRLDPEVTLPAVIRGWNALAACVTEDGKLEHVQPIGAAPYGFDPHNSEPFATGAFLMAASEVVRLADNGQRPVSNRVQVPGK